MIRFNIYDSAGFVTLHKFVGILILQSHHRISCHDSGLGQGGGASVLVCVNLLQSTHPLDLSASSQSYPFLCLLNDTSDKHHVTVHLTRPPQFTF